MRISHERYDKQQAAAVPSSFSRAPSPSFPAMALLTKRESRSQEGQGRQKHSKNMKQISVKLANRFADVAEVFEKSMRNKRYGMLYAKGLSREEFRESQFMGAASSVTLLWKRERDKQATQKPSKVKLWQHFVPRAAAKQELRAEILQLQGEKWRNSSRPWQARHGLDVGGPKGYGIPQKDRYKEIGGQAATASWEKAEEHQKEIAQQDALAAVEYRKMWTLSIKAQIHDKKVAQTSAEFRSPCLELPHEDRRAELDEVYSKELNEGFWEILANFSAWLLHALRFDGLMFALQLGVFSLLVQHYLPPLSRYYFAQSATALLLPIEDSLDRLLNEDILLANREGKSAEREAVGGGEALSVIELASVNALPRLDSTTTALLSPAQLQAVLAPSYKTQEYIVKSGESISLVAVREQLKMSTLISVNHIERAKSLRAGQKILIPNMDGVLHQVQQEDTLTSIAQKYDITIGSLIDANELQSEKLLAGSQLFVPGASLSSYELRKVFGDLFVYPLRGRLSSSFGYRGNPFRSGLREFHNGLDIVGPHGALIKASSDGKVVATGYHIIYGNYVILEHAKGMKTLYGHMSKVLVRNGQKTIQGQNIGRVGTTGRSTGPHVHFSIFVSGKAVTPLDYLSGR